MAEAHGADFLGAVSVPSLVRRTGSRRGHSSTQSCISAAVPRCRSTIHTNAKLVSQARAQTQEITSASTMSSGGTFMCLDGGLSCCDAQRSAVRENGLAARPEVTSIISWGASVASALQLGPGCLSRVKVKGLGVAVEGSRAVPALSASEGVPSKCESDDSVDGKQGNITSSVIRAVKSHVVNCGLSDACTRLAKMGLGAEFAAQRAGMCAVAAASLAPLALPGGALASLAAGGGATLAFCPLPLLSFSESKCIPVPELSMKELERGVLLATFVQGSLGLVRICLGDVFSGSYTLLLATLGYNARKPGPASNWLKTYVLITFINGTMACIDLVQQSLQQNFPVLLLTLPMSVNLTHLSSLLIPGASFLGAYCGWQHIKMQKKLAQEAYQQQVQHLLQNPPWPPPALHAQIVQSMVQYSLMQIADARQAGTLPPLIEEEEENEAEADGPKEAKLKEGAAASA